MSKKKFLKVVCVAIFAAVMAFNVNFGSSNSSLSDIALANIEALAKPEYDGSDCDNECCWEKLDGSGCYGYICCLIHLDGYEYVMRYPS